MPATGRFQTCTNGNPFSDANADDIAVRATNALSRVLLGCGSNVRSSMTIAGDRVGFAGTLAGSNATLSNATVDTLSCTKLIVANSTLSLTNTSNVVSSNIWSSNLYTSNVYCGYIGATAIVSDSFTCCNVAMNAATASNATFARASIAEMATSNVNTSNMTCAAATINTVRTSSIVAPSSTLSVGTQAFPNAVVLDGVARSISSDTGTLTCGSRFVVPGSFVGIGTAVPATALDVRGKVNATSIETAHCIAPSLAASTIFVDSNILPTLGSVITSRNGNVSVYSGIANTSAAVNLGVRDNSGFRTCVAVSPLATTFSTPLVASDVTTQSLTAQTLRFGGGGVSMSNTPGGNVVALSGGEFAVTTGSRALRLACPASGNASMFSVGTSLQLGPPLSPAITISETGVLTFNKPINMTGDQPLYIGPHSLSAASPSALRTTATTHIMGSSNRTYAQLSLNAAGRAGCLQFPNEAAPGARVVLWQDSDVSSYGGLGKEASSVILRTPPTQELVFSGGTGVAGTEFARFASGGNLMVNAPGVAPLGRMHVRGMTDERLLVLDNQSSTATTNAMLSIRRLSSSGRAAPAVEFRINNVVVGSISHPTATTTAFGTTSDYRVKEIVSSLSSRESLRKVHALNPVNFRFTGEDGEIHAGFIAHEVADIVPHVVIGEKDDPVRLQQIDYSKLVPYLVSSIHELSRQVSALMKWSYEGRGAR